MWWLYTILGIWIGLSVGIWIIQSLIKHKWDFGDLFITFIIPFFMVFEFLKKLKRY